MERNEAMTRASAPARPLSVAMIDWAAIIGGAVVAAAIAGLFTTFGAALGLATISPEPGKGSFDFWVIVTAIWVVVSLVASYLAGGYVAGRMRRRVDGADADEVTARDGINGLVVWALGMLLTAWMAAGVIGGLGSIVGAVVAGFLVGLVEAFGQAYAPQLSQVVIFMLMALVILWRPAGLFGREERV